MSQPDLTDYEIIDQVIRNKDNRAFEMLVTRHQQAVRYSLRQLTGWNEALADDLSQEVFLKAYTALKTFKRKSTFSTWLYRIAYNTFISHQRKMQHKIDQSLTSNDQDFEKVADSDNRKSPDLDLHRDLAIAMQALSVQQRSALHLYLHQQCTQQEISTIMNIPIGTVKTLINRGRVILQQKLAAWRDESYEQSAG